MSNSDVSGDERSGTWIALFSGGKDSAWALHQALERGMRVERLLTAQPRGDSYLFHVPAIEVVPLVAESISIPLRTFPVDPVDRVTADSSSEHGDNELASLIQAVEGVMAERTDIQGIVSGAVASTFQQERLERLCSQLGLDLYSPLWGVDPEQTLEAMLEAEFDIRIVAVAAAGLDRSWLGRRLDGDALSDLRGLHERYGLHLMGEGGEYETLVVDGPHMSRSLEFRATPQWDDQRGWLRIDEAWLDSD